MECIYIYRFLKGKEMSLRQSLNDFEGYSMLLLGRRVAHKVNE